MNNNITSGIRMSHILGIQGNPSGLEKHFIIQHSVHQDRKE